MNWLKNIFKKVQYEPPPKYRLRPNAGGTYTLERFHGEQIGYLFEAVNVTPEQADECIKNLERDIIYYRDK